MLSSKEIQLGLWLILQLDQALLSKSLMESQVDRSNDGLFDVFIQRSNAREWDRPWNVIQITLTTDYKLVWNLVNLFPNREGQTEKG